MSVSQDSIGYLPTINAPATQLSTVQEILVQSLKIKETLHLESIVLVFDQAIYAKAAEIVWKQNPKFESVILRLGVFHTLCTFFGIIGKRFQDAGLADICIESGIIAEGSLSGVFSGRKYNRSLCFHKLMYEALMWLAWRGFSDWMEDHSDIEKLHVNTALDNIQKMSSAINQTSINDVTYHPSYAHLKGLFDQYMRFLDKDNGMLSSFWVSYLDMVEVVLSTVRATREGNWQLHLASVRSMVPWCFAYDNVNYARYLSSYIADMSHLPDKHREVHAYFESGGFSVQLGRENTFGKIPVDQTIEETANKDTQTSGGTKGFSLKAGAVMRYYINAEYRTMFLKQLKDMTGISSTPARHTVFQPSRITKDEADIEKLKMLDKSWINPFEQSCDIVILSTGKLAPVDVAGDLMKANEVGEQKYMEFHNQRLASNPTKKFHGTLSKQKLKLSAR